MWSPHKPPHAWPTMQVYACALIHVIYSLHPPLLNLSRQISESLEIPAPTPAFMLKTATSYHTQMFPSPHFILYSFNGLCHAHVSPSHTPSSTRLGNIPTRIKLSSRSIARNK